jgi:hypothetical protein
MKDGVILRVSKPARMGRPPSSAVTKPSLSCALVHDEPPLPPAAHGELLPVEHNLALIPSLIAHADLAVFCRIERERCVVRLKQRRNIRPICNSGKTRGGRSGVEISALPNARPPQIRKQATRNNSDASTP